jgi:acetyltransferase-like isoleucine patch superfamily enzyme
MPVVNQGNGNVLEIAGNIKGDPSIVIKGNGNRLIIGAGARLPKSQISISGDGCHLEIGPGCMLRGILRCLASGSTLRIGAETTAQNAKICLHEPGLIEIGRDCMFSGDIRVDNSDVHSIIDLATGRRMNPPGDIVIEDHVWIGYGVSISKGVRIGHDAIIGSGAVVTRDVPANSVAVGVPAKVVRTGVTWNRNLLPFED